MDADKPLTIGVPEAGMKYLGISRPASYDAAKRGEIPTIKVGRLLRVPVRAMEEMLAAAKPKGIDRMLGLETNEREATG
jgi:excisionase family DNA binding protein